MNTEHYLKELSEHLDELSDAERDFIDGASETIFTGKRKKLVWSDELKVLGIWKRVMRK